MTFADIGTLDAQFERKRNSDGEDAVVAGAVGNRLGWLLGRGAARFGSAWRHLSTAGAAMAFLRDQLEPIGDPAFQGEHNCDAFAELGMSVDEIARFIATGALVSAVTASTTPMS